MVFLVYFCSLHLPFLTDINNPSVPDNILIPNTSDSTNSNMGNFSNTTFAIPPNNIEAIQYTLNTTTDPNTNQHTENDTSTEITHTSNSVA